MNISVGKTYSILLVLALVLAALFGGACSSPKQESPKPAAQQEAPVPQAAEPVAAEAQEGVAETTAAGAEGEAQAPGSQETVATPVEPSEGEAVAAAEETEKEGSGWMDRPEPLFKEVIEGAPKEATIQDAAAFVPTVRPYADKPYAEQIDKGLAWMAANHSYQGCNWMDYFVLDLLRRKFALDESLAAEKIINTESLDPTQTEEVKLHLRLVIAGYKIDEAQVVLEHVPFLAEYKTEEQPFLTSAILEKLGVSLQGALLRAMYCDQVPVTAEFVAEVLKQIKETEFKGQPNSYGGYIVSHMILACQWLEELGCAEGMQELAEAKPGFADILAAMAEDQGITTDLGMEAVALMYYIGAADKVKPEWIQAVAEAQLPDGAWERQKGKGQPMGHSTAFGLWILLENALPDAEDIAWLRP